MEKFTAIKEQVLAGVPAWIDELTRHSTGIVKTGSPRNVALYVNNSAALAGVIGYNEFTGEVVGVKACPALGLANVGRLEDIHEIHLKSYLEAEYDFLADDRALTQGVELAARELPFNPMKDWVERKTWDGIARVATYFIDYLGCVDDEYNRMIATRWFVGLVARIYRPGCKFEIVPVLTGKQGIGKSTCVANLVPREYFTDQLSSFAPEKDELAKLNTKSVVELSEIRADKNATIEQKKAFISSQIDEIRKPYGRRATVMERAFVLIATTNNSEFLSDATGERRFFPIEAGRTTATKSPWDTALVQAEVAQLFAEAKVLFDAGERYHISRDDAALADIYQERAKHTDLEAEAVLKYLDMEVPVTWEKVSNGLRGLYYRNYPDNLEEIRHRWMEKSFGFDDREPLGRTTTSEVLGSVFSVETADLPRISAGRMGKKIGVTIENCDGWVKKRTNTFRGYFREL
ncbi:hypothetical protein EQG49_00405 [Periweissella cryptocerci]|uniref:Virulence-associated protein E-like domain-containing protein n=1 Tax=Periweissella cryptocerci TaxID=2506420 RepID=A0A4V1AIC4_9LACO|nr:virulence-associated E family protein [Periweissella cryptocerci]QBO35015.1 hypothetical protein EQG49_00405 [Periweissella cryptocerci]